MIEFTNILLRSTLPLHPYLTEHTRLSFRLIVDGAICGETASVNGDLTTGTWEINSSICADTVKISVTLAVVATPEIADSSTLHQEQFFSVTLDVARLLKKVKAHPDATQEFNIVDPHSSIQFLMTCLVKVSPSSIMDNSPSQEDSADIKGVENQLYSQLEHLELPSRDDLESFYTKAICMQDEDKKGHVPNLLGSKYHALHGKMRDLTDLETAIPMHEEGLHCTESFHPQLAEYVNSIAVALETRFDWGGGLVDIERAISHYQMALALTEDRDAEKPRRYSNLGTALQSRFERLGGLADLEDAVSYQRKAIELMPDGHPSKAALLGNFGNTLQSRFERLGNLADLEDAISNKRRAVELMPDGHPDKASRLSNLGTTLQSRFERLGSLTDLEDAISNKRRAVELMPDGHPRKAAGLTNLGNSLQSCFERLGSLADLEGAISNKRRAVELTPDGHPHKAALLGNFGNTLQSRFEWLGSLTDLEDAISSKRRAVELMPDGHPDKAVQLDNLASTLQSRFERLGSLVDLEDAISTGRKAVELTPDGHPNKAAWLNNLGSVLKSRFERLGSIADLQDAVSSQRKGVELMPDGHPRKAAGLTNLGNSLQSCFERLGSLADLEGAISNKRRAVELTPDGHPHKSTVLNNLGIALQFRFGWLGSLADLEGGISYQRKAIEQMPDGHPHQASWLNNFATALQSRFERLSRLADLGDAISNFGIAVELTPDGHPDKASRLSNLGITLQSRFERLGTIADLEDAISNQRKAVELTPDGHPEKAGSHNNLGNSLHRRFERLGRLADLEDAISYRQKAVELTPDGHPNEADRLSNLAITLQSRFQRLGNLSDLEGALYALSTAANSTNGPAMVRFKAACLWAEVAEKHSRSPLNAFSSAINLLPRIAWLGLAVTDQHALLADVGDIVRDAVAAAIKYEEYETAVIWAEQGRSIVWQNLLGLRSPVDVLCATRPDLADRLLTIAQQLEGSGSHIEMPTASVGDIARNHSKLAIDWDNLINEIRSIPNFEGFLRAKDFSQLAPAAYEGPVVILNINESQCDALVLITDDSDEKHVSAINIPLENFSYEKCKTMFQALKNLLSSAGLRERNDRKTGRNRPQVDGEAKFQMILGTLWRDVVKPVIERLAFQTQSERPPRIWWCATGLLAFLPIHAAGLYDTQEIGEKISDYVVSSYTPTITAILDLSSPVMQGDFQVLTVAQPSAPGGPPIPKTEDEVQIIHSLINGANVLNLTKENATMQRVQEGMMESNWIHLACHGQQNPDDPMKSGFLLQDGILKLSQIVTMKLPKTEFAFLSACQTAMGDEKVADESVHLAAAMFLSGCRGVIATTWSIRDDDAPRVAQVVYSRMFKDGKSNGKEAAYALHEAVKLLRDSGAKFTSWVPFIHLGR